MSLAKLCHDDGSWTTPEELLTRLARRNGFTMDVMLSIWLGGDLDGTILDAELKSLHWLVGGIYK